MTEETPAPRKRARSTNNSSNEVRKLETRLAVVERNASDLAGSFTKFVEAGRQIEDRLKVLEDEHSEKKVEKARQEERNIALMERLGRIEGRIGGIENGNSKLLWLVIGSVVVTIVGFMFSGGFRIS